MSNMSAVNNLDSNASLDTLSVGVSADADDAQWVTANKDNSSAIPTAAPPIPASSSSTDNQQWNADDQKFLGQKERRKSSSVKMFLGDYLSLASNSSILKVLAKNGDSSIIFSDIIIKINKRNKMQERILMVTDQAIYNVDPGSSHKVKRRIPLKDLGGASMSTLPDNFFCLHVPSEYDYLLVSNKKTEIITKIKDAYEKLCGSALSVEFGNSFEYRIDDSVVREILFTNVEGGISTQIFTKKKKSGKWLGVQNKMRGLYKRF